MTTEREKIVALARTNGAVSIEGSNFERYALFPEQLEAFYKAAQAESFNAAAVKCKQRAASHASSIREDEADECAAAIREMAKENGK